MNFIRSLKKCDVCLKILRKANRINFVHNNAYWKVCSEECEKKVKK